MNLLAHLFLTRTATSEQMLGNFIADQVKGKAYSRYPEAVAEGILLHRWIDSFTDEHPLTIKGKQMLHSYHGKWAGVVIDVLNDHFLATEWERFSPNETLPAFIQRIQKQLALHRREMGENERWTFDRMVHDEWLLSYQHHEGLRRSFDGLSKRTGNKGFHRAITTLREFDQELRSNFISFFPELISYVSKLEAHGADEDRPAPDR